MLKEGLEEEDGEGNTYLIIIIFTELHFVFLSWPNTPNYDSPCLLIISAAGECDGGIEETIWRTRVGCWTVIESNNKSNAKDSKRKGYNTLSEGTLNHNAPLILEKAPVFLLSFTPKSPVISCFYLSLSLSQVHIRFDLIVTREWIKAMKEMELNDCQEYIFNVERERWEKGLTSLR